MFILMWGGGGGAAGWGKLKSKIFYDLQSLHNFRIITEVDHDEHSKSSENYADSMYLSTSVLCSRFIRFSDKSK